MQMKKKYLLIKLTHMQIRLQMPNTHISKIQRKEKEWGGGGGGGTLEFSEGEHAVVQVETTPDSDGETRRRRPECRSLMKMNK